MQFLLLMLLFLICNNSIFAQKKECNYIKEYYPKAYQVRYALKEEKDKDKAYKLLNELRQDFELLNIPPFYNVEIFLDLAMERNDYKNAQEVCRILIKDYGYIWDNIPLKIDGVKLLDTLDYEILRNQFMMQIDSALMRKWALIQNQDKACRMFNDSNPKRDSLTLLMRHVDSVNNILLKEIFEQYGGYPSLAQLGGNNSFFDIVYVFMHITDERDFDYWKNVLYDQIKKGKCSPFTLARVVDRRNMFKHEKIRYFVFDKVYNDDGVLEDVSYEMIFEPEDLNNRRISIGLPPLEIAK